VEPIVCLRLAPTGVVNGQRPLAGQDVPETDPDTSRARVLRVSVDGRGPDVSWDRSFPEER